MCIDDMLITRNNSTTINSLIRDLGDKFNIKKLGLASTFLGIQVNKIPWATFYINNNIQWNYFIKSV